MSEPIRTSATKRKQLAAALKRNMARRKAVASRASLVASEASATSPLGEAEKRPSRFSGEGMSSQPLHAPTRKGTAS